MPRFVMTVLAALMFAQPALPAADNSTAPRTTPSSFVPHPHTNHHVYGAPIQPAIVGHAKNSHHKHSPHKP
jgi:hypothetical protein